MANPETSRQADPALVVVGNCVRYLAQSGARAGLAVTGLDGFADQDMRAACGRWDSARPDAADLQDRASSLFPPGDARWTYGAGFESGPGVLQRLARRHGPPLGNDPDLLAQLADPRRWFALLDRLGIRHPETRHEPVEDPADWLDKPAAGCGGVSVRRAGDGDGEAPSRVYQRYLRGPLCSLTFAADGHAMMPLGFNRLHACFPAAGDFRFAGVVSGYLPGRELAAEMLDTARRLTTALGLRGINGIDFVIHRQEPWLLDLNARPPASLELYEERLRHGGLVAHLDACNGRLPPVRPNRDGVRGMRILYAQGPVTALPTDWPDWLRDRPASAAAVVPGEPLCSLHASGGSPEAVEALLRERADQARALFNRKSRVAA